MSNFKKKGRIFITESGAIVFVMEMETKNTGEVEKETDYDLIQVLDHYSNSKEPHFNVEFRPTSKKLPNGEWNANPNRLWPEDSWTSIKRVEV